MLGNELNLLHQGGWWRRLCYLLGGGTNTIITDIRKIVKKSEREFA